MKQYENINIINLKVYKNMYLQCTQMSTDSLPMNKF